MARYGVTERHLAGATLRRSVARADDVPGRRARATDAVGRAARPRPARPHRPRDPRHRPGRAAHPREDRARRLRRLPPPPGAAARSTGRCSSLQAPYDARRVLPAEGGGERLELLLLVPVPAARSAGARSPRSTRSAARSTTWSTRRTRSAGRARPSSPGGARRSANLFAGNPQHPVTRALAAVHREYFGSTQEHLNEIIDGMEMDLTRRAISTGRRSSATATASPASSACSPPASSATATRARSNTRENLGIAFQLTNIIRDVGEDARKNRIYLPMDELQALRRAGRRHPAARARRRQFRALMRSRPSARAATTTRRSRRCRPRTARAQRPGLIMAAIYRTLLDEIERDGFRVLDAAHLAHAAAQVLDRMENLARGVADRRRRLRRHGRGGDARRARRAASRCSSPARCPAAARAAHRRSAGPRARQRPAHPDRRLHRALSPDAHGRRAAGCAAAHSARDPLRAGIQPAQALAARAARASLAGLLLAHGIPFAERLGALRFMAALQRSAFRLSTT